MAEKNYPIEVFILFSLRRHGGWTRRLRNVDLRVDARSVCKTAPVGTTCPTSRSKWLRRCAFSDLCRSSTINSPPGGDIGVRVLPASCVLVPKCYACAFLAQQEKPEVLPVAGIMQKEISIFFRTRPESPPFCTLDSVVATIVAMKI